jgi:hypothetical protein
MFVLSYNTRMQPERAITTRIIRPGEIEPDDEWKDSTPGERIVAVWTLTRLCYGWGEEPDDEPRLQRSVVRIQRREC